MIPQQLLANEAASCTFADVLLSFLVHQMDDLAGYEERSGSCMIWMRSRWGESILLAPYDISETIVVDFWIGRGGWGGKVMTLYR